VLWGLLGAGPALAMSAQELFEDGNRLFRDDLYWAALLRYRQAEDAGMDTPLLHYNAGVAHYKAGQYERARESLEKATRSTELQPLAHFNLGLNAFAAGEPDEALRWFRLARDQARNPRIAEMAARAMARIRSGQRAEDPVYQHAVAQRKEKDIFDLSYFGRIGFGNDSNVFRTPADAYIDLSNPNLPLIVPEIQTGTYLPVDLGARYMINSYRFEGFYAAYRLSGAYYQDRTQSDADEFSHELSIGNEYDRRDEDRRREVYSAFRVSQHNETYYDPDDGTPRTSGGVDIADRMNYLRYGPDIRFRQSREKLAVGAIARAYLYDYEDVVAVPSYDHEYFQLAVHTQYKFTPTSLLRLTVEGFTRRYSDRPSYDLDGTQSINNPAVRYDYLGASLLARQRITRNMWFGFEYERTDRRDYYVGYNNYVRDHYEFEFSWSPGVRFDLDLRGYYRNYQFENAFAFNNAALPRKTLESARLDASFRYRITPRLSIVLDGRYDDYVSNDTRIQYDRARYSLGVVWQQD